MSEKLLYISNGVFHKKSFTNGLNVVQDDVLTTIKPTGTGSYVLNYDADSEAFSFDPFSQTSSLEKLNSSYFITSGNSPLTIDKSGTIPYFTDSDTFAGINLPSDTSKRYVLRNKQFVELSSTPSSLLGSSYVSGLMYANANNEFKFASTTSAGDYVIRYSSDSSGVYSLVPTSTVKRELYIEQSSLTSGPTLITGTFGSSASSIIQHNLSSDLFTIETGKSYMVSVDIELFCSNYADVIGTRDPASFTIKYDTTGDPIVAATLANPLPYQHFSGSSVITSSGTSFSLYFNTSGTGTAGAVNYYITRFKVTIVSV